jgi:hypothetical protein
MLRPRQISSRSLITALRWCQNPPLSMSSQWATASSSRFCFFCLFFSVLTCPEIISFFHEMTAHCIESFRSCSWSNAMRNARTFPGGLSACVSLKTEWTLPWLRIQPMRSVASSAVSAASLFLWK